MFYTIYKTVNQSNGKFYLGKHITRDPYDSYLGSGAALKCAIEKYGKESFKKDVLFIYDNKASMDEKEREILTECLLNSETCYNMKPGGDGGSSKGINANTKWINNGFVNKKIAHDSIIPEGWFSGIIKKYKQKPTGGKKSKGKIWITDGIKNTMIHPSENIPEGWYRGRNKAFSEDTSKFKNGGHSHKDTMWINNGVINKRIDKHSMIEDGWVKGKLCRN